MLLSYKVPEGAAGNGGHSTLQSARAWGLGGLATELTVHLFAAHKGMARNSWHHVLDGLGSNMTFVILWFSHLNLPTFVDIVSNMTHDSITLNNQIHVSTSIPLSDSCTTHQQFPGHAVNDPWATANLEAEGWRISNSESLEFWQGIWLFIDFFW